MRMRANRARRALPYAIPHSLAHLEGQLRLPSVGRGQKPDDDHMRYLLTRAIGEAGGQATRQHIRAITWAIRPMGLDRQVALMHRGSTIGLIGGIRPVAQRVAVGELRYQICELLADCRRAGQCGQVRHLRVPFRDAASCVQDKRWPTDIIHKLWYGYHPPVVIILRRQR